MTWICYDLSKSVILSWDGHMYIYHEMVWFFTVAKSKLDETCFRGLISGIELQTCLCVTTKPSTYILESDYVTCLILGWLVLLNPLFWFWCSRLVVSCCCLYKSVSKTNKQKRTEKIMPWYCNLACCIYLCLHFMVSRGFNLIFPVLLWFRFVFAARWPVLAISHGVME